MPRSEHLYSRFVYWSKILLPLLALVLLSTMFLFARGTVGTVAIPYAELEEITRDPRMAQPVFSGVTGDGSVIAITAETMRPVASEPDSFTLDAMTAEIGTTNGGEIHMTSNDGSIDGRNQNVVLSGEVEITTSDGYVMKTAVLNASIATGRIVSDDDVDVQAPFGTLTAGQMEILTTETGDGQEMIFTRGVKLLYQPQE